MTAGRWALLAIAGVTLGAAAAILIDNSLAHEHPVVVTDTATARRLDRLCFLVEQQATVAAVWAKSPNASLVNAAQIQLLTLEGMRPICAGAVPP